ncbi:DUF605-domain-containing protein [Piedraia hortae CBS 480.64]|uniref:DUF605-domain-containing protein n=1 Tax=Piedraia hortae CBS 480.64 TaxID=1314780 RepID=A0A6A7BUR9_9PEZI|nr:DUF605-domain-containing protein [Piedraia hortae CBS 480.64]
MMPPTLPAKAKRADLLRFALRAAELQRHRPYVSYWLEYFILQRILALQLHLGDDECQSYALQLMDKLEAFKASHPSDDVVTDDLAAKAYIENFAMDTFKKADDAQRVNKVTKQTGETFQAAATFMDALAIWGDLDPEIQMKSKFAKFHAVRIGKAVKMGQDPNDTNPEETAEEGEIDRELRLLQGGQGSGSPALQEGSAQKAQTLQEGSLQTGSAIPPGSAVVPPGPTIQQGSRDYFPTVPGDDSLDAAHQFYETGQTSPMDIGEASSHHNAPVQPSVPAVASPPVEVPIMAPSVGYRTDDEAVLSARKHAKWAISALEFDDVNTAVKELRDALTALNAV